ncbi:MAG TPA: ComEC/Rec2 family competence protein [Mycobacteriales bacterium]|nr:ComEC/Rec2 family competence protein [Mycobacteriales bacterium]
MRRSPVDLRLAVVAAAAWTTAAVLMPMSVHRAVGTAGAGIVVAALAMQRRRRWVSAAAIGVAGGAAVLAVHAAALHTGPVARLAPARSHVEVQLRLVRDPVTVRSHSGRRLVVADATATAVRRPGGEWRSDRAPVVVFAVDSSWVGLLPGQRVDVGARLAPPRRGDTVAAVLVAAGPPRVLGRPPMWQRSAGAVRSGLRAAVLPLPPDERGLVPGLVLGDVSQMPTTLSTAFRVTGLAHLTAVSGANVAIVLGTVMAALRWSGAPRWVRPAVGVAALLGFVVLVRPSPSVLRAAVMGAVVLAAGMTGRRSRALPAVSAAVLGLVMVDPFLARSPGFAMSVFATTAIVTLAPAWTVRLARVMPRPIAAAVAVPAAAQLACTPVIVAVFGQLTPYAVPANLLAAPAVAPATLAGIGCALAGVGWPGAAAVLAWAAGLPTAWLVIVARTFAGLPGAGLPWPTGMRGLLLLCGSAAAGTTAVWSIARLLRHAILGRCPV